jgi:biotin-(acetyl-CoA carboxylase) ligase
MNCNQRTFPLGLAGRACSLYEILGREVELPGLLETVLAALAEELRDPDWRPKLERRLYGLGRAVVLKPVAAPGQPPLEDSLRGIVAGVAEDGALLLESAGSARAVYSGELAFEPDP